MVTLKAWQHIYANVEVEQSPQRRRGFQTLFYTRSALTEAEIEKMESRLAYFSGERLSLSPSDTNPRKLVFYRTDNNNIAVGQCVPLTGEDRFGRGGRYIAHSLIFPPEQFERIGNNPFAIFQHFRFITTVEEALSRGDVNTGDIGEVTLEAPSELNAEVGLVEQWREAGLKQLAMSALEAEQLSHERTSLAFYGAAEEIEQAILTAFLFLPPPLRLLCSFDTYFHRCNINATYFWAVGFSTQATAPNFIPVDAGARRILKEIDYPVESPYQRWAFHAISSGDTSDVFGNQAKAYALSEFLMRQDDNCPVSTFRTLRQFFNVNRADVEAKLHQLLSDKLPLPLANRLMPAYQSLPADKILNYFRDGFEITELATQLDHIYLELLPDTPNRTEINALGKLLKQFDHRSLRLLHACWKRQREPLQRALMELSDEEYREFVEFALQWNLAKAEYLIINGKGELFLDIYLPYLQPDDKNIVRLAQGLLDAGEANFLSRLLPLLSSLSPKNLRRLYKLVAKAEETPADFLRALAEQEGVVPAEVGLFGRLRGRLGRK